MVLNGVGPPPRDAQADILGDGADPGELARVVARVARGDQRLDHRPAGERRQDRTVARRRMAQVICRPDAAGARHDLHRDGRIARNVPPEVARHEPRKEIDAAARRAGHIDHHRPIDHVGGLGIGARKAKTRRKRCDACAQAAETKYRAPFGHCVVRLTGPLRGRWVARIADPRQSQSTNVDFETQKKPRPFGKIDRGPVRKTASGRPSGSRRNIRAPRLLKLPNIVHRGLSLVSDTAVSNAA